MRCSGREPVVARVALALAAVALVALAGLAVARGRRLAEIRAALGAAAAADGGGDALADSVRRLRDRLAATDGELERKRRDVAYLLNLIGTGVVRLDASGRVESANAAAHRFLSRSSDAMIGRPAIEAFVESVLETGSASGDVAVCTVRDADGPTLVVRVRRSPVGGAWIVLEDVGELRRLQRIRAAFIDNLSHELRAPKRPARPSRPRCATGSARSRSRPDT